jgi:hypothetical protein
MTGGPGAKDAPHPFTDEEPARGHDLFGMGERERQAVLDWVGENLTQVRRSVYEQRLLHWSLGTGFVVGLAVHVGDDRAAGAGGRPALCARLRTVDRGRGGRVRSGLSRGKTTAVQAGAGCLRGSAAREGPSRHRPGVRGGRSADGEVYSWLPHLPTGHLSQHRRGVQAGPGQPPSADHRPAQGGRPLGRGTRAPLISEQEPGLARTWRTQFD